MKRASSIATALAVWGLVSASASVAGAEANSGSNSSSCPPCPAPLITPKDASAPTFPGTCCAQICVSSMFTKSEFSHMERTQLALAVISLLLSTFIVLTWITFKKKRKQRITLWFAVCSNQVSLIFFVVNAFGQEKTWCASDAVGHVQSDVLRSELGAGPWICLFQSIWIQFFALAAFSWWFCQVMDLYFRVTLSKRNIDHYLKFYHAYCWSLSTVTTVVLLACGQFGYTAPRTWCYLGPSTQNWVIWVVLYIPVTVYLAVGVPMMVSVIRKIIETSSKVKTSKRKRDKFKMYRTPLYFVVIFLVIASSMLAFVIKGQVNESEYRQGAAAWIQCLLANAYQFGILNPATNASAVIVPSTLSTTFGVLPGRGCGESYPARISVFLMQLAQGCVLGQAILVFLVFGPSRQNWNLWVRRLGCGEGEKDGTIKLPSSTKMNASSNRLLPNRSLKWLFKMKKSLVRRRSSEDSYSRTVSSSDGGTAKTDGIAERVKGLSTVSSYSGQTEVPSPSSAKQKAVEMQQQTRMPQTV